MRQAIITILLAFAFVSCGGNQGESYSSSSAREAANRFYNMLIDSCYSDFVAAIRHDSLPEDLLQEETDMIAQFAYIQQRRHNGIKSAKASRDSLYGDSLANVFVSINFGDNTSEEVLLPLIFTNGRWMMQ